MGNHITRTTRLLSMSRGREKVSLSSSSAAATGTNMSLGYRGSNTKFNYDLERQPLIDDENDDFDVENEEDATKMFGTTLRKKRTTTIKTAAVAFACVGGLFALVSSSSGSSSPASLVKRFVRTNEGVGASSALADKAYGRRTTSTTSFLGFGGKKATTTRVRTTAPRAKALWRRWRRAWRRTIVKRRKKLP